MAVKKSGPIKSGGPKKANPQFGAPGRMGVDTKIKRSKKK